MEQLWIVAYLNMLLCFQSKSVLTSYFDFLFWSSSAILLPKWNRFSQSLYQSSVSHVTTLTTYYHGKCVLIYKLKRFPLVKLWYTIWTYGGSKFQSNNIKKHSSHIIYSFWNCLSRNQGNTEILSHQYL